LRFESDALTEKLKLTCHFNLCSFTAARQPSAEGATDNSQPMSDIITRQGTIQYEPLDVNRQGPVSYEQLPSQTGHEREHYNVGRPDNTNTPYEQLNINTQRPPVYDRLAMQNER